MKRLLLVIGLAMACRHLALSQSGLYMPHDVQIAYENETRSYTGDPGKNYWQNSADYHIKVFLDTDARTINGEAQVVYYNNSPGTIDKLVVRLYQDLYKKGNPRDFQVDPSDLHDGVEIHSIRIAGVDFPVDSAKREAAVMILPLEDELPSGGKTEVEISWAYQVAQASHIREGYYDPNSFFIAYWYPQIAVYDDVWGWNTFNHTGMQEFYNDFNNYSVEISVPKGFVVWATGTLQNPEENLSPTILEKYRKARESDSVVAVIDKADYENLVTADKDTLVWSYEAENVTDFSFAASDNYLWHASNLTLSGRDIFISAAFNENSLDFYEVAGLSRECIRYFSQEMPAVDYPYPSMTVFNGSGGMEFPMMVNDASQEELWQTVYLTSHEIAHTYFPFYMGINEQFYPFMDEGWAMMLPFELQRRLSPTFDPIARSVKLYEASAGGSLESQPMLPAISLSGNTYRQAYRNAAYYKPGLAYLYLQEVLGRELFLKALHAYIDRWRGKHPLPYDFFFTFNEIAGEDLSWFWKPWFFEAGYPDLRVTEIAEDGGKPRIVVENAGKAPTPLRVAIVFSDGEIKEVRESAAVWKDGDTYVVEVEGDKEVAAVQVGNLSIPDVDRANNLWKK